MKKAHIALFEDSFLPCKLVEAYAKSNGNEHSVVTHTTRESALGYLAAVHSGEVEAPDVVLLDGNLGSGHDGEDARELFAALAAFGIGSFIIGYSSEPMTRYGVPVNFDAQKDPKVAFSIINQLEPNEPTA